MRSIFEPLGWTVNKLQVEVDPKQPKDIEEVINYVSAMSYGIERVDTLPLSLRLIQEVHSKLLKGFMVRTGIQVSLEKLRTGFDILVRISIQRPSFHRRFQNARSPRQV